MFRRRRWRGWVVNEEKRGGGGEFLGGGDVGIGSRGDGRRR